ncbi:MAG: hypothetical protein BWY76_02358 [bacterium ADurb.Bin429]|nr:MAG: hypothetical protein BWY76_02358 [bacterium ADurb.Bin429]
MSKLILLALFAVGALLCLAQPAAAQTIPNVRGLQAFTAETRFMSLPGYLRWQYFVENDVWISRAEANALVTAQRTGGA